MSRRGRDEIYEERGYYREQQSAPAPAPVRARDLEEIDISVRRGERDRVPDFLRDDYARDAQPLVLRARETETFTRPLPRRSPSPPPVRTRIVERERVRERSLTPPPVERVRTRVVERERERERSPEERYRTRIIERERERPRSPSIERTRTTTTRVVERERERSPEIEQERIRIIDRERRRSPSIESSPSPPPAPPVIRAPPIHQEIITHHRHIDHGYEYQPAPTPPPPIRAPPREERRETEIDIHTGNGNTEIDIFRSKTGGGRPIHKRNESFYDDDVLYERDRDRLRVRDSRHNRRRSLSTQRIRSTESEETYYANKVDERAYIGEAYNGATKDWAIVDVPPGTERVRMDGVGGGSQEITWQRYNGVRRSKFNPGGDMQIAIPERERESRGWEREREITYEREEVSDRRVGMPRPRNRLGDLWTEITKDLVVREAIEELGYDFEETEYFFYVIQFLRYEDVQELVMLSEEIRKERQNRIREIQYERERIKEREEWERRERERARRALPEYEDERIIEREIIYDAPRRRGYR